MRKKILFLLLSILFSFEASATRILWVGIGNNPQVEVNGAMTPLATWIASLPCEAEDVGGRIRVDGVAMPAGYEDPSGYIPTGQTHPSIVFDSDTTEFGISMASGGFTDWQSIRLDNTDLNATVFFDLGYWDADADWNFVQVASASAVLGDLWNKHTYERATLNPPIESPWRPFATVPEPSSVFLAIVGIGLLFKRRKNSIISA